MDQSNKNSNGLLIAQTENGLAVIGEEQIINTYICEGLTSTELATKFGLDPLVVSEFIENNELDKLRAAHIKHGLAKLQSTQLAQAEKLMTLENQFKRIRLIQIEKMLEDYMAYYSKYGHFYKVHPVTSEILKDTNGIPLQIKLPNVSSEITQLKESFSLSEGLKVMLSHIDDVINKPKDVKKLDNSVIDVTSYDNLFKKKTKED